MNTSYVADSWRNLLLEEEMAGSYAFVFQLHGAMPIRIDTLERLLPSLLYLKAVGLFDEALEFFMQTSGLSLPSKYNNSLHGRIEFLADNNFLQCRAELHRIRERRNELAHQSGAKTSWKELAQDRKIMHDVLETLKLVAPAAKFESFGHRSELRDSSNPEYEWERDFTYEIRENGVKIHETNWKEFLSKRRKGQIESSEPASEI